MSVKGLGYGPAAEEATWANISALCADKDWLMLVTARSKSRLVGD